MSYEEALAARPKARRPADPTPIGVNIKDPVAGQDYAKLPFTDTESFLVERRGELRFELSSEWCGLFEHWLAARYRRGGDDENSSTELVSFPTLHLQRDELAGLLRFQVELEWLSGEQPFAVPTYPQRRRGQWPAPPERLRLKQLASEPDQVLPFFIDARVLHDTLRIDSERIDSLFAGLREIEGIDARRTVESLCELIEEQNVLDGNRKRTGPPADHSIATPGGRSLRQAEASHPSTLLTRLVASVSERLTLVQSRARVYAVALVVCADQTRATWHLQRDLHAVKDALEAGQLDDASPLHAYLTGAAPKAGKSTCWGRWRGAGLTDSQRAACELALGSTLAAVQGPPGTGKTTLILNMLAHTLVRKVAALSRSGKMGKAITVVTSTNNRAVDNVVDPLGRALDSGSLPLTLRVGSKQVVETVTLAELRRVQRWLKERSVADLQARPLLERELERFRELHTAMETRLSVAQLHEQRVERQQRIALEIAELRGKWELNGGDRSARLHQALLELSAGPAVRGSRRFAVMEPAGADQVEPAAGIETFLKESTRHAPMVVELRLLAERLEALSELSGGRGQRRLEETRRHFKQTKRRELARIRRALGFELLSGRLPPVPEPVLADDALETWEQAAELSLNTVREVAQLLLDGREEGQGKTRLATLQKELAALEGETAKPPPELSAAERTELDRQHLELFESAVRVREAWASVHRAEILISIELGIRAAQDTRSLRSLLEKSNTETFWLRELFPAWGCTLLSLGNMFPSENHVVDAIVIDEAGQCHPAYAVAALFRADSVLIIGDTNQLEPVVGLSLDDERRIARGLDLKVELGKLAPFRAYSGSMTSAQSLADRAVATRPTLVDHFRCQPEISGICESLCHYGLVSRTPRRTRANLAPFLRAPVLMAAVDGAQERFAGSWMNEAEACVTLRIVSELLAAGLLPNEIGVVTPYRGQLEQLWRKFRELGVPLERPSADVMDTERLESVGAADCGLAVGTVHRFQGGERSIILFTTTVTEARSLSFIDARVNLLNVAASRARDHLITIGHRPTLGAGRHTRHLLDDAVPLQW